MALAGCVMSEDRLRQPAYKALCVCPEHRCSGGVELREAVERVRDSRSSADVNAWPHLGATARNSEVQETSRSTSSLSIGSPREVHSPVSGAGLLTLRSTRGSSLLGADPDLLRRQGCYAGGDWGRMLALASSRAFRSQAVKEAR